MASLLSFTRDDAAALPLTTQTVAFVIAQSRRASLAQLAASVALAAGLGWIASATSGAVSLAAAAATALSMWGVLATLLSTWDHFRISGLLRKKTEMDLADAEDPRKFWWAHRGVFPVAWT